MKDEPVVLDFETKKIERRPAYPPVPVGVAIKNPGGKSHYFAWGHPEGNNCDIQKAGDVVRDVYRSGNPVLCHNGPFDHDIAECYFGVKPQKVEDSLFLAFLSDPRDESLSLKPLAAKHLDWPPDEQDAMKEWMNEHIPEVRRNPKKAGEYISECPGDIVAPYACGDTDRTLGLWEHLRPKVYKDGMGEAYERELALIPITMEMERSGLRIDTKGLKKLGDTIEGMDEEIMGRIRRRLRVGKDFNVNSGQQLAEALQARGKLDKIFKTKTGKVSTKMENLKKGCTDQTLITLLGVHSISEKYLSTFVGPWLAQAALTGGRILPGFNQVRSRTDEGYGKGTRTGRFSSYDPNLQQVSQNVDESSNREMLEVFQAMLKEHGMDFIGLRDYFLPDEGRIICAIDYSQQELRMFAHFENDELMEAYLKNPKLDVHEYVRQLIYSATGKLYERKHIKSTVFGILYGMGLDKLAARLGVKRDVANSIRNGVYKALPGIKRLQDDLKRLANADEPLVTWGGRRYLCEPAKFSKERGEWQSFEYKMLNTEIQASSADYTKQGMLNVAEEVPEARIAAQIHDELLCMIPNKECGPRIQKAMCRGKLRVPMLAEPKYSDRSWARAKGEA